MIPASLPAEMATVARARTVTDTAATPALMSWAVTIERSPAGSTGVAMTPASLVELFAAAPTARQSPINDANKPWE